MSEEYRKFDAADCVKTGQDARELLSSAAEEDLGDGVVMRAALKHVARTWSMGTLARDAGLNKALSEDGNPTLAALLKVTRVPGLRLRLEARRESCTGHAVGSAPGSSGRNGFDVAWHWSLPARAS